jgi:DUF3011 family protein
MLREYRAALLFATLTLMPWLAHAEQRQMKCESWNFQPATCDTGLQTTNVTKYQQLSAADCTLGSTWSYDSRYIKVTNGCRAVFTATGTATGTETGTSTGTTPTARQMKCESWNFQPATCDTGLQTTNVTKYQQLSAADCTLGSTWSYDSRYIKVTNGCRAVFTATGTATGTETGTSTPTSTTGTTTPTPTTGSTTPTPTTGSTTPTPTTGSTTPTPSTGSTTPTPTTGSTTPDPTTDCPS